MRNDKWRIEPGESMEHFVDSVYNEVESEITNLGWSNIIKKYHPDNNIDNPDALEIFNIYRHVYDDMTRKTALLYRKNQREYEKNKARQQVIEKHTIKNYETIINRFYYLSIVIFAFVAILLIIKVVYE